MFDFIADYASGLFGLMLTAFTGYLDYRQSNRSYNWKFGIILILGICIFFSSIIDNANDRKEKRKSDEKIDSLNKNIRVATQKIQNMQISQNIFENVLLERFKIIRDTTDNLPKRINTYNTTIGTAGTVNIGRD